MDPIADADLVERARTGDMEAFVALYDRYVDPLYDFVAGMVRDRDAAADTVQEIFVRAMGALPALPDPARARSWLFAIARDAVLEHFQREGRPRQSTMPDEDGIEVPMDAVDPGRLADPAKAAEARDTAALVWEASAGLDPRQLSILDLHLRQGLSDSEVAEVLGVSKDNGGVLLNRLMPAAEDAIAMFVMWKEGRHDCPALDAEIAEVASPGMSPEVRRLVGRHLRRCEACRRRRTRIARPLATFAAFAPIAAPPLVRAQILDVLKGEWETAGPHARPEPAADGAGEDGPIDGGALPAAPAGPGGPSALGTVARVVVSMAAGGAILAALLLHPDSPLAIDSAPPPLFSTDGIATGTPTSAEATPGTADTATPSPRTATPTPGDGTPSPAVTATPPGGSASTPRAGTATATATAIATPPETPTSTPMPTSTPTVTPTPTATPCVPEADVNLPGRVVTVGPAGQASFFVINRNPCQELEFTTAVADAEAAPWLSVRPSTGLVTAPTGFNVRVFVDFDALPGEGDYEGSVVITGPGNEVVVTVQTSVGKPPEIQSASATCGPGGAVSFAVTASDDFGITRAYVTYQGEAGQETLDLALQSGDSPAAGTWTGEPPGAFIGPGFTAAVVDGGGRMVTVADDQFACGAP